MVIISTRTFSRTPNVHNRTSWSSWGYFDRFFFLFFFSLLLCSVLIFTCFALALHCSRLRSLFLFQLFCGVAFNMRNEWDTRNLLLNGWAVCSCSYYCLDNVSSARKNSFLHLHAPWSWSVRIGVRCVHEFMYDAFSVYANNNEFCVRKMAARPGITRTPLWSQSESDGHPNFSCVVKCYDVIYILFVQYERWHWCCLETNIFTFIVVAVVVHSQSDDGDGLSTDVWHHMFYINSHRQHLKMSVFRCLPLSPSSLPQHSTWLTARVGSGPAMHYFDYCVCMYLQMLHQLSANRLLR